MALLIQKKVLFWFSALVVSFVLFFGLVLFELFGFINRDYWAPLVLFLFVAVIVIFTRMLVLIRQEDPLNKRK